MSFLPIVGRELRGASRRRGTYWLRAMVAGAAVLIGVVIFLATLNTPVTKSGEIVFEGLAGLLFMYCLLSGRLSTVDCLSSEKREGTLGLLFLTDLKGYDVVLGKLVANSLGGFYGLLAVMPVLALSMLLGGISNAEFWRMALVLADTFLFSLAIGIFCSSVSRDARRATSANFALLLLFVGASTAIMGIISYLHPGHPLVPKLYYTCPVFPFILCFDIAYVKFPKDFWWSVGVIHALTWLLIALAAWIVPRTWQDRPARAKTAPVRNFRQALSHGPAAGRAAFRRRMLNVNPFYWLTARARLKPLHVWIFMAAMAGWWCWGWLGVGSLWLTEFSVVVLLALLVNSTLKLWATLEACAQLSEDQRNGTLELLLPTPLGVRDILRGQELALRRQFLGPLVAAIAAESVLAWLAGRNGAYANGVSLSDNSIIFTTVAGLVMLFADLIALSWVAMRMALTAKSTSRAAIGAVARVLMLPWLVFGAVNLAIGTWNILWPDAMWRPGYNFKLGLWFGLGICADLYFGLTARHQLLTGFRQLAMHRFNAKRSLFARWFGNEADAGAGHAPADAAPVRVAWWRRKLVLSGAVLLLLLLLTAGFVITRMNAPHKFPPPVVVSITQSNTPLVFVTGNATFLVLPDNSLWRWGMNNLGRPSEIEVPELADSNRDWVQVAGDFAGGAGLRRDGTLWGWGMIGSSGKRTDHSLTQIGLEKEWISLSSVASYSLAIKRDGSLWGWGNNLDGELGFGPGGNEYSPVQVGADHDWAAIGCSTTGGSIGLRTDGTLWTWGRSQNQGVTGRVITTNATPARASVETNWTRIETGFGFTPAAWNAAGELWELPVGQPNADTSIASTGRLIVSNSGPGRLALAYIGNWKAYQVQSDGTLWETSASIKVLSIVIGGAWRRIGTRSDWVFIQGRLNTALGLTADGTLWTWGVDYSRKPQIPFSARVKMLQSQISQAFTHAPMSGVPGQGPAYVEQPRPLMRLVTPAAAPAAGSKAP